MKKSRKPKKPKITKKTIALQVAAMQNLKGMKKVRARASVRKAQALLMQKRIKRAMKVYNTISKVLSKVL